jgi:uncharacterized protein
MKIVLPGGSGQVGTVLAQAFHDDGHEVVVLSRNPRQAPWRVAAWDGVSLGAWTRELEGAEAVVNLAGRSVDCRYGRRNRRRILESRVLSTRAVGAAVAAAAKPPRVWLQASTATIYAHRYDAANGESSGILGGAEPGAPETWRFSIEVATAWERAAKEATLRRTRQVLMRSAILMAPSPGGAFSILLRLVRWGLGGPQGDGRQFVSWIHDRDLVPLRIHCPTPASWVRCALHGGRGSASRPASGCSPWERSPCAPRASSCSRAGAWCPSGFSPPASPSTSRAGKRRR